jgi:hypothetical protein
VLIKVIIIFQNGIAQIRVAQIRVNKHMLNEHGKTTESVFFFFCKF